MRKPAAGVGVLLRPSGRDEGLRAGQALRRSPGPSGDAGDTLDGDAGGLGVGIVSLVVEVRSFVRSST